ncbi:ABC transporter permease [Chondrinema litorale]|uniref:ABC transporter permease n=1 Tax=Chondrinema litorale TaxID=2994555 RepID=UPI002542F1B5|nr:ABC transporter permease [Chondrinema litorale]UZR94054.1 ABC transporter permease [Chondrinema litorale]
MYRFKLYSFINILGLAVGISFFTLLLLLVRHELSYDTHHKSANKIFRITKFVERNGVAEKTASVPFPFGPSAQKYFPEYIDEVVRIFNFQVPTHDIQYDSLHFNESLFYFADESFFKVFDYPLQLGDESIALNRPYSVIISDRAAKKYFGEENPIGKKIVYDDEFMMTVTGVFEEKKYASHFDFDFIASFASLESMELDEETLVSNWKWDPCWTYILLKDDKSPEDLEYLLNKLAMKNAPESYGENIDIFLQPIKEIHLYSDLDFELAANSDVKYVYIFSVIALLILIVATINFTNLSSAKSSFRAREVGIRKAIGADNYDLVKQFVVEFMFISLLSIILAFILVELLLPFISEIAGTELGIQKLETDILFYSVFISGIVIGLIASIYPAYFLTRNQPSEVLGGSIMLGLKSKRFRGVLVVVQFTITIFLLITTYITQGQFSYFRNADLGFNHDDVIMISVSNSQARFVYDSIKTDLLNTKYVESVTGLEEIPGISYRIHDYLPGLEFTGERKNWIFSPAMMVRQDFLETFGVKIIAGRDFDKGINDEYNGVIINQQMAEFMGYTDPQKVIGKQLRSRAGNERIVGVVKDFNFESLHHEVKPFVIDIPSPKFKAFFTKYIAVKVEKGQEYEALGSIKKVWSKHMPHRNFEYFFLSDKLEKLYFKEQKLVEVTIYFSIVSILIACLGLFGLSSFLVDMRRKEIAIRKAIGTTDWLVVWLLLKEFLILVGIAVLIAWPISYFVMENWLRGFPYRMEMSLFVYFDTAIIAFLLTLITVSYHTLRAAFKEPTEALQA